MSSVIKSFKRGLFYLLLGLMSSFFSLSASADLVSPKPYCSITYGSYVSITWPSVSGATGGYVVYRSTSSSFSWSSATRVASTYSTYYYDYSANCGTVYYYWIGASDGSYIYVTRNNYDLGWRDSSICSYTDCERLTSPKPTCSTTYSSYVYISWSHLSSSGCTLGNNGYKYKVYRSTSSTFSWNNVTRLADTSNSYYYDYSATPGTTYYYWIGYHYNGYVYVTKSSYGSGKRPRPPSCTTLTSPKPICSTTYSSYVYISWSHLSSSGCTLGNNGYKYKVYRSTSSTFSWNNVTRLADTSNSYYYDYSATPGTTYYYWIGYHYNGYVYVTKSSYGSGKRPPSCTTLTSPKPICSISYDSYVYISWSHLSSSSCTLGNNGYKYRVYRSTSSTFSWSNVKALADTSNSYYYDYSATPGITYYYWIGYHYNGYVYVTKSSYDWGYR